MTKGRTWCTNSHCCTLIQLEWHTHCLTHSLCLIQYLTQNHQSTHSFYSPLTITQSQAHHTTLTGVQFYQHNVTPLLKNLWSHSLRPSQSYTCSLDSCIIHTHTWWLWHYRSESLNHLKPFLYEWMTEYLTTRIEFHPPLLQVQAHYKLNPTFDLQPEIWTSIGTCPVV